MFEDAPGPILRVERRGGYLPWAILRGYGRDQITICACRSEAVARLVLAAILEQGGPSNAAALTAR